MEKMRVIHRMYGHTPAIMTETLLLGTFNPSHPDNPADFFYGRRQNHLWTLLPGCFGAPSLKGADRAVKQAWIAEQRIDFLDLIQAVEVENPTDYRDDYLDGRVAEWWDVIGEIKRLPGLKRVCFTRKTFSGIPNMAQRVGRIRDYCLQRNVEFHLLPTPARIYSTPKQEIWRAAINPIP